MGHETKNKAQIDCVSLEYVRSGLNDFARKLEELALRHKNTLTYKELKERLNGLYELIRMIPACDGRDAITVGPRRLADMTIKAMRELVALADLMYRCHDEELQAALHELLSKSSTPIMLLIASGTKQGLAIVDEMKRFLGI